MSTTAEKETTQFGLFGHTIEIGDGTQGELYQYVLENFTNLPKPEYQQEIDFSGIVEMLDDPTTQGKAQMKLRDVENLMFSMLFMGRANGFGERPDKKRYCVFLKNLSFPLESRALRALLDEGEWLGIDVWISVTSNPQTIEYVKHELLDRMSNVVVHKNDYWPSDLDEKYPSPIGTYSKLYRKSVVKEEIKIC